MGMSSKRDMSHSGCHPDVLTVLHYALQPCVTVRQSHRSRRYHKMHATQFWNSPPPPHPGENKALFSTTQRVVSTTFESMEFGSSFSGP